MNIIQKYQFLYRAWRYRFKVEPAEVALLRRHLKLGQTAVDIGAHKGAYTWWMQKTVGGRGRVIAFEPQPELAEYLKQAKQCFGWSNVDVVASAVSSMAGDMSLFRPEQSPSPGATLQRGLHEQAESLAVRVETLDHYFSTHPGRPIHFIKCDVEGHELDVFEGAADILQHDRPVLLFECEQRHHQANHQNGHRTHPQNGAIDRVFTFLEQHGYEGWFHYQGELCDVEQFQPEIHQVPGAGVYVNNFLFVNKRETCVIREAA